jgi:hypothetical protein
MHTVALVTTCHGGCTCPANCDVALDAASPAQPHRMGSAPGHRLVMIAFSAEALIQRRLLPHRGGTAAEICNAPHSRSTFEVDCGTLIGRRPTRAGDRLSDSHG